MSLKTFLARVWAQVESLFFHLPADLQQSAQIAVEITEKIKDFDTRNPEIADIITVIIPGDVDDKILTWLRAKLPVILTELRLINTLKAISNPAEVIISAINTLQQLDGNIKSAFLHDFSILVAQEIAKSKNNKLEWADAVYIVEWYYQHKYKGI